MTQTQNQFIYTPSNEARCGVKSVFLAGTTSRVDNYDWRELLSTALSDMPVTVYNPYRTDRDSSWREDIDFAPTASGWSGNSKSRRRRTLSLFTFTRYPGAHQFARVWALYAGAWKGYRCLCRGVLEEGKCMCKKYGVEMVGNDDGVREADVKRFPVLL
jgi:hypothetical protein